MKQKISILADLYQKNCLTLPLHLLPNGIQRKKAYLRFGLKTAEVDVKASEKIPHDIAIVSRSVIEGLMLPLSPWFEVNIDNAEITLGPSIGILACKKQETLHKTVQNLSNYLYDYSDIGGAVLAFSNEGIDVKKQLIEGYLYNPITEEWDYGSYAYPLCIFKRSGMNRFQREHFHSVLGNKIFNSYFFDKWEMYEWLHVFPEVKKYLPETVLYQQPADVTEFLDKFPSAYIKPVSGSQGMGIFKAEKRASQYCFHFHHINKNNTLFFSSAQEAQAFLKEHVKKNQFIVQQGIEVIKKDKAMVDFRVLLVKGYHGEWKEMGIVARYGATEKIVSNVSSGGSASMGEEALRNVYKMTEADIFNMLAKIAEISIFAAKAIESCGIHCGNLGVDVAIDQNLKIWIIEINNKDPNHTIAIDAGNKQLFYQTKKMNMLYAKKMAGF